MNCHERALAPLLYSSLVNFAPPEIPLAAASSINKDGHTFAEARVSDGDFA